jgi:nitrogen regulatory protein PII 1
MFLIRAIIRPEKASAVINELNDAGFPAVTKLDVAGRGRQRGIKIGDVVYDEIPKEMLMIVVKDDKDKDDVVRVILRIARTNEKGAFGDGKIFVSPIEEVYTISSSKKEL